MGDLYTFSLRDILISENTKKIDFAKSKNSTHKSCHICFSDDKNALGVIPRALGFQGHSGGHSKSWSNEKMLLTKVVMYASMMKKITSPSHGLIPGLVSGGAPGIFH